MLFSVDFSLLGSGPDSRRDPRGRTGSPCRGSRHGHTYTARHIYICVTHRYMCVCVSMCVCELPGRQTHSTGWLGPSQGAGARAQGRGRGGGGAGRGGGRVRAGARIREPDPMPGAARRPPPPRPDWPAPYRHRAPPTTNSAALAAPLPPPPGCQLRPPPTSYLHQASRASTRRGPKATAMAFLGSAAAFRGPAVRGTGQARRPRCPAVRCA